MFIFDTFYTFFVVIVLINFYTTNTNAKEEDNPFSDKAPLSHFMVSIRTRQPNKYFGDNHYCGGVIISEEHILTAGHCATGVGMVERQPRELLIVAGSYKRLSPVSSHVTQQIGVSKIFLKKEFQTTNDHNIAVLKLKSKLAYSDYTQKIEINEGKVPYGADCTTLGWGRMYPNGPLPNKCVPSNLNILTMDVCRNISKLAKRFGDNMICAGDLNTVVGHSCDGDSGNPLICDGKLVGIATWTIGCKYKSFPSFFESVAFHIKFINESMEAGSISIHTFQTFALPIACVIFVLKSFDS